MMCKVGICSVKEKELLAEGGRINMVQRKGEPQAGK